MKEKHKRKTRKEVGEIFDQLNKPGTVTRGLTDLYRADGPSTEAGKKVIENNPALKRSFDRLATTLKPRRPRK